MSILVKVINWLRKHVICLSPSALSCWTNERWEPQTLQKNEKIDQWLDGKRQRVMNFSPTPSR